MFKILWRLICMGRKSNAIAHDVITSETEAVFRNFMNERTQSILENDRKQKQVDRDIEEYLESLKDNDAQDKIPSNAVDLSGNHSYSDEATTITNKDI